MIVFNNTNPLEVKEGDGSITIEIDPVASEITEPTEVEISTVNGSALSTDFTNSGVGVDFSAIDSLTTTIDPDNPDTLNFTIDITEDAIAEPEENFQFQVTATEDPDLNGTGTVLIIDDDGTTELEPELEVELEPEPEPELEVERLLPSIAINSVEQSEGDSGNTKFEFTVSLSEPSEEPITVDYSTTEGTAESEARFEGTELVDAADYIPSNGTLEFAPGETEKTIVVEVIANPESLADETEPETFSVNLSNASNADLDQFIGTGTILNSEIETESDNSELPLLQLDNQSFPEGNLGENTAQNLTVSLIDSNGEPVVATEEINFTYRTVDINAAANLDYEFIPEQTATIDEGESETTISLTIIGDEDLESEESLNIVLSDVDSELVQFGNDQSELETVITIQDDDSVDNSEDNPEPSELEPPEDESEDLDVEEEIDNNDLIGNIVFRFSNSDTGGYLYTASDTEKEFIEDNLDNYQLENSSFASVDPQTENATDVFRFFNASTGGYLYTTSSTERDFIEDNLGEFAFENVAFSAFASEIEEVETVPVYRFFEINTGVHLYTADETERTFIEDNLSNYSAEGVAFYALPAESDLM